MEFACSPGVWVDSILAVGVICLLFMLRYVELATSCSPPLAPRWMGQAPAPPATLSPRFLSLVLQRPVDADSSVSRIFACNTMGGLQTPTFPELPHLFIPTFLCPPPTVRKLSISLALLILSVFLLSCTYLRLSPVIWKRHARMSHRHIRGHDRRWE